MDEVSDKRPIGVWVLLIFFAIFILSGILILVGDMNAFVEKITNNLFFLVSSSIMFFGLAKRKNWVFKAFVALSVFSLALFGMSVLSSGSSAYVETACSEISNQITYLACTTDATKFYWDTVTFNFTTQALFVILISVYLYKKKSYFSK